ncbi:6-carboxytetrahydropterin synthase [Neptunomonas marina]|uniref:6-carboxy-5,6,7,8-tetrahydropterin synthase n=1 Tax=Neptunomonas marina TaxID=1815562 RepID=A0A437Q442_9GAMM|nr:6-carboxytetrahydropterin synthase [Neptunomonas marina]RVU29251.1 hypothetical protein EOE65_17210 [Neptunomonas marina]
MKLFVNNLTNIDFSYLHTERGLMGESWLVQLQLDGALNDQGMICDFGIVKKVVKEWMDTFADHVLLVPVGSDQADLQYHDQQAQLTWHYKEGEALVCQSPAQAIIAVETPEITPQSLAQWCEAKLKALFPGEVKGLKLHFVAEPEQGAFYHYSHGLQQHEGNCQRIAHGHRSQLHIYRNGQRDSLLEREWAERWQDIYLGTTAHRQPDPKPGVYAYCYQAPQGQFELSLPASRCYDLDTETTVELIAEHLAEQVKAVFPDDSIEVHAFEGIGKGAISVR